MSWKWLECCGQQSIDGHLLDCAAHPVTTDLAPGHGGNAGLCLDDHTCSSCEAGRPLTECVDLFEHPVCGTVACTADEA